MTHEKSVYRTDDQEYKAAMATIAPIVDHHHKTMVPGEPQLNYCDDAVQVSITIHAGTCTGLYSLPDNDRKQRAHLV